MNASRVVFLALWVSFLFINTPVSLHCVTLFVLNHILVAQQYLSVELGIGVCLISTFKRVLFDIVDILSEKKRLLISRGVDYSPSESLMAHPLYAFRRVEKVKDSTKDKTFFHDFLPPLHPAATRENIWSPDIQKVEMREALLAYGRGFEVRKPCSTRATVFPLCIQVSAKILVKGKFFMKRAVDSLLHIDFQTNVNPQISI